jgi:hypothetical protein
MNINPIFFPHLNTGTPLRPLIAVNCTANAGHKSVPERWFDSFGKKKGIMPWLLAK